MAYDKQFATATIAMEASGEGPDGELAVAFVLLNRVKDGRWGKNLASVVLYKAQFSCWNTFDPNRSRIANMEDDTPDLEAAGEALAKAESGIADPTLGATHYYAASMPRAPVWAATGHFTVQIGKHRFYNNVK